MRIIVTGLLILVAQTCLALSPKHDINTRRVLKEDFREYNSGIVLFGHQNAIFGGYNWKFSNSDHDFQRSDVYELCGKYPAVLGVDLGDLELNKPINIDYVKFDQLREGCLSYIKRGGKITISWHMNNPVTGGDPWDTSDKDVVNKILTDSTYNAKFLLWIDMAAKYLKTFINQDGTPVTIYFRPFHENNIASFWWGQCTDADFISLWRLIYDRLANFHKLRNLVWIYSPYDINNYAELSSRYPGDKYVDIIGYEKYQSINVGYETYGEAADKYFRQVSERFDITSQFAEEHKKMVAFCETGFSFKFEFDNWWTDCLTKILEQRKCLYVLTWWNQYHAKVSSYGPNVYMKSAEDFINMSKNTKWKFINVN